MSTENSSVIQTMTTEMKVAKQPISPDLKLTYLTFIARLEYPSAIDESHNLVEFACRVEPLELRLRHHERIGNEHVFRLGFSTLEGLLLAICAFHRPARRHL